MTEEETTKRQTQASRSGRGIQSATEDLCLYPLPQDPNFLTISSSKGAAQRQ